MENKEVLALFKELYSKLEHSQEELFILIRDIYADVTLLKDKQNRHEETYKELIIRGEQIKLELTEIQSKLKIVRDVQEERHDSSSFWSHLVTNKAFDLFVSGSLILIGFLVGNFIELDAERRINNRNKELPPAQYPNETASPKNYPGG